MRQLFDSDWIGWKQHHFFSYLKAYIISMDCDVGVLAADLQFAYQINYYIKPICGLKCIENIIIIYVIKAILLNYNWPDLFKINDILLINHNTDIHRFKGETVKLVNTLYK